MAEVRFQVGKSLILSPVSRFQASFNIRGCPCECLSFSIKFRPNQQASAVTLTLEPVICVIMVGCNYESL